jgi:hypothetical protein
MPAKVSHTSPLALASGHVRYTTVTSERKLVSVGEWPLHKTVMYKPVTVSHFRGGYVTAKMPRPKMPKEIKKRLAPP